MFKVYEVFGAQNPALVGSSSSSPVACLEPHGAGDRSARWQGPHGAGIGRWEQSWWFKHSPHSYYINWLSTHPRNHGDHDFPQFSSIFPMISGMFKIRVPYYGSFPPPKCVGMLLRRPALLRGLWPWQFGQRRPLGLYFHRSARELSRCNKSIT